MSIIDLNAFRSYFEDEHALAALGSLSASWFVGDSCFDDDQWVVEDVMGNQSISFDVAVAPGELLTANSDLCRAVKISAYILRSVVGDRKLGGSSSGLTQTKHVYCLVNHIRWLKLQGISNLSSVSEGIFSAFQKTFGDPLHVRLDLERRLQEKLDRLEESPADIDRYTVYRETNIKPDFLVTTLAQDLGVSDRILSNISTPLVSILTKFRLDNGFYFEPKLDRYARAKNNNQETGLSADSIRKELTSIAKFYRQLQVFKDLFPDSQQMPRDFFQQANIKLGKVAKKKGRAAECTKDIPQPIFFELMDHAIRWVVDYASPLLDVKWKALEKYRVFKSKKARGGSEESKQAYASKQVRRWLEDQLQALADQPGSPYPISGFVKNTTGKRVDYVLTDEQVQDAQSLREKNWTYQEIGEQLGVSKATAHRLLTAGKSKSEGQSLNKYLHHFLPTACLLVIYCFTARRQCEVESLQAGCCHDTPNGPVMKMYSAKVYQEHKFFPITKLVAKAVSVLEALTETVRDKENQSLLRFPILGGGAVEYWSSGKINEFAEHLGIPDNDGVPWRFSEHQFRRFFAMMFYYKYEGGDLATLSWHLRHTDFEMTAKYITDKDFRLAFDQVRAERIVSFAESAAKEESVLRGNMQQELGCFFRSFDGVSEGRAEKMIGKAGEISYVLNFVPDGACFGQTPNLLKRSKCLLDDAIQLSSAGRSSCVGCPNLLGFDTGISAEDVGIVIEPASSPMLKAYAARQEPLNV